MRRFGEIAGLTGLALGLAAEAKAQTEVQQDPGLTITVTAKRLDDARATIQPSLGATRYEFSPATIDALPQGQNAPLNQVLLRAPGVAHDSFGQFHVRGDHSNVQYRLDGVQLPEGLSLFGQVLATRFAKSMSLITGAVPAQYGFRTAGIVDIGVRSGLNSPGAELSMTGGSRDYLQPAFSYGDKSGKWDWFLTGDFTHTGIGIESPVETSWPTHAASDQWHGLAKVNAVVDENTRLSFIFGGAKARFQIPNVPYQTPAFTVNGSSDLDSSRLDQRQWESTYFGIASLQKSFDGLDLQTSVFTRYSSLAYKPDPFGDLMFNGIAPSARTQSLATGIQTDASWRLPGDHTVRGGFLVQRERATALTSSNVLPTDDTGAPTSDQPMGMVDGYDLVGWTWGVYLQDQWKIARGLTLNFGARFDVVSGVTQENQLSPRVNLVWEPNSILTVHGGYARYFTPPSLATVSAAAIANRQGTTAATPQTLNDAVRAERAHYFDFGIKLEPEPGLRFGFGAYYKIAENLLDEGQFGAPIILTSFNYAKAEIKGVELSASFDEGPWALYGNLAWSQATGTNIVSSQYNFDPAELAFISQNYINLDHDQNWTASAGAAYIFNQQSPWATRVAADFILGSGLRASRVTPNDTALPTYAVVNLSAAQKIPVGKGDATLRLDVLNAFDHSYMLRDGSGVGVGAPQWGLRRTFLVTLSKKF
jgi:outer membrane receptor protein involved in Fe transport